MKEVQEVHLADVKRLEELDAEHRVEFKETKNPENQLSMVLSQAEMLSEKEFEKRRQLDIEKAQSGFDMKCKVSVDTMRRIREHLLAEPGKGGHGGNGGHEKAEERQLVEVPARVCPASKHVPLHKDKHDGRGTSVSCWICVVYLNRQPGSTLAVQGSPS